ncbi:hypothetical protein GBA52_000307 [Prunus armeniaca]|nr:hypothetical protein GBA52_000307 [Prunus armeniaca]
MGDAINTSQIEAKIPPTETMDHTDPYLYQTQSTPPPAAEAFYSSSSYYPKPLFSLELTKFSTEEYAQLKSLLCDGKPRANFISKIPSFCAFTGSSSTNPWIPDSEATNHIAPPSGLSVTTPLNSTVDLPDGSHAKISGLGSPSLGPNLSVDGKRSIAHRSLFDRKHSNSPIEETIDRTSHDDRSPRDIDNVPDFPSP